MTPALSQTVAALRNSPRREKGNSYAFHEKIPTSGWKRMFLKMKLIRHAMPEQSAGY